MPALEVGKHAKRVKVRYKSYLQHALLDGAACDQAQHHDTLLLAHAVSARQGLQAHNATKSVG